MGEIVWEWFKANWLPVVGIGLILWELAAIEQHVMRAANLLERVERHLGGGQK